MTTGKVARLAFRFVLLIGIVNFFADMTYEGARSITGPFLESLGASAAIVGFVAGFGELVGYGLRSFSGYFADKTHRYWAVTFAGYFINMMAVPALALAGSWPLASALMVAERTGRAIRRPAVETMISHAGKSLGSGRVFGFNEALDQAGATTGPLITAFVVVSPRRLPSRFCRAADLCNPMFDYRSYCACPPSESTRIGRKACTSFSGQGILQVLLDISFRRSADCRRFCGFCFDRVSFPEVPYRPSGSYSGFLCHSNGRRRDCLPGSR